MIRSLSELTDQTTQALILDGLPVRGTPARIIGFTGLDGSGKTGTRDAVAQYLDGLGKTVVICKSPCDTHIVGQLNNIIGTDHPYAAQLLFTYCDHLLSAYMEKLKFRADYILCQRGPIDQYVHGMVRGKGGSGYKGINEIQRPEMLEKYDAYVHMNCAPETAWKRIQDDPDKDVFEFPEYIKHQALHTKELYEDVKQGNIKELSVFNDALNIYVDTTDRTEQDAHQYVITVLTATGLIP